MIIPFPSTPKLYSVTTVAKENSGCKDASILWFRCNADEASQLKDYLDREHGTHSTTTIDEVSLPVENYEGSLGAMAVGGSADFYMLDKEPEYSLPFRVWGYFDLIDCELTDGSGVYHHRLLLVMDPNGVMRQQPNEEAAPLSAPPAT